MKKIETIVALLALTSAPSVWAGHENDTARLLNSTADLSLSSKGLLASNGAGVGPNLSVQEGRSIFSNSLKDEVVGISPQAGVIGFADSGRNYTSRAAGGLIADFNAVPLLAPEMKDYFLGITTGGLYSHMGSNSSNFFGSNSDDNSGANLAVIPVDLKVGYHLSDKVRVSVHGGGNLTYRSVANSADFGGDSSTGTSSSWQMLPNAGADLEVALTKEISLAARPDVTFTTGQEFYMGTIGVVAPLSF